MNNLNAIKHYFYHELICLNDEVEPLFYYALESINNLKRSDFIINPNKIVSTDDLNNWLQLIKHLKQNKPIQYFFGKQSFYGLEFKVNKHTLIPRSETEELVEWIISNHQNKKIKILDIGTGTGCIAITLAKNLPLATVSAIDISDEALSVAKENALSHQVEVDFLNINVLEISELNQVYDIVVSNPPYVRDLEKIEIMPNVLDFEPHQALFVSNEDPLIFYRKILELAKNSLKDNGNIYFEINQYLSDEMKDLFESFAYKNYSLKKDLKGNFRMMKGTKVS